MLYANYMYFSDSSTVFCILLIISFIWGVIFFLFLSLATESATGIIIANIKKLIIKLIKILTKASNPSPILNSKRTV